MRLGGCAVAMLLVACGGSGAGLLPDGGEALNDDADYLITDAFESVTNPNNATCPHPASLTRVGQVRAGKWIENTGPGNGTVSPAGEVSYRGSTSEGTIFRTGQLHADGSVTGGLTFTQAACSGTYTTTGHRR